MRKRKPVLLNGEALMVDGKVLEFDAVDQEELDGKIDAPQTAAVGEVLTVEEVGEDGKPKKWKTQTVAAGQKQADWNQNDETAADYVKNRPFYVADEAPLGEVVFTARSVNAITHTVNAMSIKVLTAILSTTDIHVPRPQIRLFLCGKFYAANVYFDRGNLSFTSDEISGHVNYNTGREWYLEFQDNSVSFTVGESYSVAFFDINNKGYVKIPLGYFPDSIFTQESAPVRYGDGNLSTIQGSNTTASANNSHAEGMNTTASGIESHAEGSNTTASGDESHAEGYGTKASGDYSHVEGFETIASGDKQHVQGIYNLSDTTSAHIVGNGTSDTERSNAYTLDWEGNAWFAGDVYVHSTSGTNKDDGSVRLATEDQLTDCVRLLISSKKNNDGTITYSSNFPALFVYYVIFKERPVNAGNSVECCMMPIDPNGPLTVLNYTGMSIDQNSDGNIVLTIRFSSYTSGKQISAEIKDTISGFGTDNENRLSTVVTVTENTYLPTPATAQVGQIVKVKAVDADGKITETETVNIPTIPQPFGENKMIATEQIGENEFGYTLRPIPTKNDFIDLGITAAQVGQIVKVKAVDDFGNPHEWEAVDVSTIVSVAYNEETGNLQIGG